MTERTSPTATKASLNATLARLHIVGDDTTLGPPVKCIRCKGRGVIELTSGTHRTIGNTLNNWHGQTIEATPENPIYVGCDCRKQTTDPKAERFA